MDKEILKKQIKKGYSVRKIAESLGKSDRKIRYWLHRHRLETKLSYGKPHLCKNCGETDPNNFYHDRKQECKPCFNKRSGDSCRNKRIKAIELAGGSCRHCGYDKCSSALEFHHIDPTIKDAHFRGMRSWTLEKIKKELDNCVLLCANCHREEHERLRQN